MTTAFVTGGSGYLGKSLLAGLVTAGYGVRAMARSSKAAEIVSAAGATPVRCDLDSAESLAGAMDGCELVVHAAGRLHGGGGHSAYTRDNVDGTRHALAAARRAGVRRLVYVGAAGSLMGGRPIIDADEGWPLRRPGYSPYFRSKAIADTEVRAANAPGFATCVVRPGLIWGGDGDPLLEAIAGATRAGKMMLVDGGRHRIVTSHIDNTVRGILLALEKGRPGEAYFVFDDGDIETRRSHSASRGSSRRSWMQPGRYFDVRGVRLSIARWSGSTAAPSWFRTERRESSSAMSLLFRGPMGSHDWLRDLTRRTGRCRL
jgi:nucleoside-diphosphate-sugar epimerase